MNRRTSRVLAVAAIAVLALTASACGSSKKTESTTTTNQAAAAAQWAGSVCSSFTTWSSSVEDLKSSLKGSSPSSSDMRQAGRQLHDETDTLIKSLEDLGLPPGAPETKEYIAGIEWALTASRDLIAVTLNGEQPSASELNIVRHQLAYMKEELQGSLAQLKKAGSQLEKAFERAPTCSSYVSS